MRQNVKQMSSLSTAKNIIFSSWKIILAFILGVVAHALVGEWASQKGYMLQAKLGLGKKSKATTKTVVIPPDVETFDDFEQTLPDVGPLPESGIEELAPIE